MFIPRYQATYTLGHIITACLPSHLSSEKVNTRFGGETSIHLSASDALLYALRRFGISGRVVVPAYTCDRVVQAVLGAGCEPIFCDVELSTGTLEASGLTSLVPGEVCAVVATHIFGMHCHLEKIRQECRRIGAVLIEDCALAMGSVVEHSDFGLADMTIYSFGRAKTVSFGVGGLLSVRDDCLTELLKECDELTRSSVTKDIVTTFKQVVQLLAYWRPLWLVRLYCERYIKRMIDIKPSASNTRSALRYSSMPEFFANMLSNLLCNFDYEKEFAHRKHIAAIYNEKLVASEHLTKPVCGELTDYVSPGYPIFVSRRNDLYRNLLAEGIDTGRFYSYNVGGDYTGVSFPNSDKIAREILLLPNHQNVAAATAEVVVRRVNAWVNSLQ